MKKICYVVTVPLTIRAFFIPQLRFLASKGFDVSVICSPDEKLQDELGSTVRYLPVEIPRGLSVGGSIKAIKTLKRVFDKEKFDLIQYSTPNAALYASIAAKVVGCKVRNYHLMGFRYLGANGVGREILKVIERVSCALSSSIECVSKSNLEIGVNEGIFSRKKATIVWNGSSGGVDLKRFNCDRRSEYRTEIREKYGITHDEVVYGFVGRVTKDKGVNEILEAFSQMDGTKLFMIGPQEGTETLNQSLYQSSLTDERIIYTGSVVDVEKYYSAIDVLLLPSYREGFGNVVIEAAAMGTPAIVSNIPGPIDTIDAGKTALTVEVKNVYDLSEKMKQIGYMDFVSMGVAAARFSKEKFDSEELCRKILNRKEVLLGMEHI
jgi:glycosyltransferase involved in cell wall biosynthesis